MTSIPEELNFLLYLLLIYLNLNFEIEAVQNMFLVEHDFIILR